MNQLSCCLQEHVALSGGRLVQHIPYGIFLCFNVGMKHGTNYMPTREPTTFAEAIRIERELLIQRAKIAIAIFDKLVIEAKEHEAKVAAIQNEIMHLM
jgi:hypothetical protein